ncbi:MAG: NAD-dependent deacylase [Firmicutes bacterium]|nr:NAD-dependent deacylase [Bacillota bacterium]HOB34279.1 NAD-dependent deacylase [Bacillota bacterium]HPZ89989.1 NAD-dependent deacylase [Bacillota bacterium]HQE01396.1 NAD-dependent deacylase [Bacillota bacterium]
MDEIKKLAEMLRQSKDTLVLTGAGISTESGIPDFRSPGTGLWTRMDPMELLSRPALERDPVGFWRRVEPMFRQMAEARPNEGHYALARLEKAGLIRGVVTQNIDSLHQKAGANVVLEVHGHLRSVYCPGCGAEEDMPAFLDRVAAGESLQCRCGQIFRPHVVLFGDQLPECFNTAWRWARVCDLLVVVGSSLEVAPVCWLVPEAKRVAIINMGSTQCDYLAEVVIRGRAGEILPALAAAAGE